MPALIAVKHTLIVLCVAVCAATGGGALGASAAPCAISHHSEPGLQLQLQQGMVCLRAFISTKGQVIWSANVPEPVQVIEVVMFPPHSSESALWVQICKACQRRTGSETISTIMVQPFFNSVKKIKKFRFRTNLFNKYGIASSGIRCCHIAQGSAQL